MPFKSTLPKLGKKCGRRERESRHEGAGGAILRRQKKLPKKELPSCVVAAEDIPVFRKAALFAGRRWNEDLGRLVIGISGFLRGY